MARNLAIGSLALILLGALGLVGYLLQTSPFAPPPTAANQVQRVAFYHYFSGPLGGGIDQVLSAVAAQSQDLELRSRSLDHEAFKALLLLSDQHPQPPELLANWAGARVHRQVEQGSIRALDDFWEDQNLDALFAPSVVTGASTYDGQRYLVPLTQHVVLFFYHVPTFQRQGLEPPQDWPAFLDLCAALQEAGVTPIALGARHRWPAQFWLDYLLLRSAGPDYRDALLRGEQRWDDEPVLRAVGLWVDLIEAGYFGANALQQDWDEAVDQLQDGSAAMTLMGTWALQRFADLQEGEDYDVFAFPVIDPDQPDVCLGPIDGVVLTTRGAHQEAALQVLAALTSQEAQLAMSQGSGALAPSLEVGDEHYTALQRRIRARVDQAPTWAFNFDLSVPEAVAQEGLRALIDIMNLPEQHPRILKELQQVVEEL